MTKIFSFALVRIILNEKKACQYLFRNFEVFINKLRQITSIFVKELKVCFIFVRFGKSKNFSLLFLVFEQKIPLKQRLFSVISKEPGVLKNQIFLRLFWVQNELFYLDFKSAFRCSSTSFSRFLKILGNEVKITAEVIIPATKSAIPSDI